MHTDTHRNIMKSVPRFIPQAQGVQRADMSIAADAIDKRYFELGWDWGGYSGIDLPEQAPHEMRQGWVAARKKLKPVFVDRYQRKWLSMRFNALRRSRVVDPSVTPQFLATITPKRCPVLLEAMTCATGTDLDWSVDRLYNDGAYAIGNIAIMSVRANSAKGQMTIHEVSEIADQLAGSHGMNGRLSAKQWARLAATMVGPHGFATGEIIVRPQCTLVPMGTPAAPPQIMQNAILADAVSGGPGKTIGRLRTMSTQRGEQILHKLVQAIRHKAGRSAWVYDVWLEPGVFDRFQDWLGQATEERFYAMHEYVATHDGVRRTTIDVGATKQAWALPTHGYALEAA